MAGGGQNNPMTPDGAGGSTMRMPEPSYGGNPAPNFNPTPPTNPTPPSAFPSGRWGGVAGPNPPASTWQPPADGGMRPPMTRPGFPDFGAPSGLNPFSGYAGYNAPAGPGTTTQQDGVFNYTPGRPNIFGGMFGGNNPFAALRGMTPEQIQQMAQSYIQNRPARPVMGQGLGAINPFNRQPE